MTAIGEMARPQRGLFGEDFPGEIPNPGVGYFKRWKIQHGYGKREKGAPYRCKTCYYYRRVQNGAKAYQKCALMGISASSASDIAASAGCQMWSKSPAEAECA